MSKFFGEVLGDEVLGRGVLGGNQPLPKRLATLPSFLGSGAVTSSDLLAACAMAAQTFKQTG